MTMASNLLRALTRPFTTLTGAALLLPAAGLLALLVYVGNDADVPATMAPPAAVAVAAMSAPASAKVQPAGPRAMAVAAADFSPGQTKAIEKIVKDYLIANPEVMLEVQRALQEKSAKEEADRLKVAINSNARELFHRPGSAIAGNPKGDVTVVEFFDYNCGFCKRAFTDVSKLVAQDKNVRVVFKELPILSRGSEEAARVALAARLQGKYWEVHQGLLTARGRANAKTALKVAEKLGLDMARLKKDMTSAEVDSEIKATRILAEKMGVNGTPHFFVGDRPVPGAPDNLLSVLSGHVVEIRKKGCSVC